MKNLATAALLTCFPALVFASGHGSLGGHGTGVTIDTHVMERKTGGLVMQTTQDVWIWDSPPEGFPAASTATCNQYIAFGAAPQPIGGTFVCRSVDPDGDVTLNTGAFQPDRFGYDNKYSSNRKMGSIYWNELDWKNNYPSR